MHRFSLFWVSAALYLGAATPAYAYVDPGSGSMIIQLTIAAVAGGLWTLKLYWLRVKRFFGLERRDQEDDGKPDRQD